MRQLVTILALVVASFALSPATASAANLVFGVGPNGFIIGFMLDDQYDAKSYDYQPNRRQYNYGGNQYAGDYNWRDESRDTRTLSGRGEAIGGGDYCAYRMEYHNGRYYCVR